MVITGTSSAAYCKDFGSVVLSELTDNVSVAYTLTLPDASTRTFTEHYSPDESGSVRINDLGDLALAYFEPLPMVLSGAQSANYSLLMVGIVSDSTGTTLGTFSQTFYYSNCRTTLDPPHIYRGFLSRYRRRKVGVDQPHFIGFILNNQKLGIGVAYRANDTVEWIEFTLALSSGSLVYYRNLDVPTVVEILNTQALISVTADDIVYYILYLKSDSGILDAIQVDVDHTHYPAVTNMVYYNCFGIPDSIRFVGKDNRTTEMDASYVSARRNFLKINTQYHIYHEVNTGYINEVIRDSAEDLVNSDAPVYLYRNGQLGERITITEVTFDESKPRTEPISVRVKYRISNECQRVIDRDMTLDYRIFDHTFGDTFE